MRVLVGRERELGQIAEHLVAGQRIVTVTGPAGVGKTRVIRIAAAHHPFCDLASARDEDDVRRSLLEVVGADSAEDLNQALAGSELLVLDGVERLLDVLAPLVSVWSQMTPILVASRQRLNLREEALVVVEPMATPQAVQLLKAAARASGTKIDTISDPTWTQLANAVDGLPLALELAAPRLRTLGADVLLEQLARPLDALRCGPRDGAPHHASLERAIALSWELLDESEQRALARLAVFVGTFSSDAATHVLERSHPLEMLETLCNKSLVQPNSGVFRLLAPVRAFAQRRATHAGWQNAELTCLQAEALFRCGQLQTSLDYLDRAAALDPLGGHVDEVRCSVLRRMGRFDAARKAGERALEQGRSTPPLVGALAAVALDQGDLEAAYRGFEQVRDSAAADRRSAALAIGMIGHVEQERGHLDEAAEAYDEAAASLTALSDARLAAVYQGYRATLGHERCDEDADERYERAICAVEPHGPHFAGLFAACRGALLAARGDPRSARTFAQSESLLAACTDAALLKAVAIHRLWLSPGTPLGGLADGVSSDDVRFALRILRRGRARDPTLCVGTNWVSIGSERIDLSRRKVLWRVLHALIVSAGDMVPRGALIAAGWGDERIVPRAAAHRLRVAIHELRRFGLSGVIESGPDGYRLTCTVTHDV